jgi:maltose phosphorylase
MGKIADQYLGIDPWKIVEEGFHSEKSRVSESLFSLGNEHMGVRGYFEEGSSGSSLVGCYLNGIYEEHFLREPMAYKGISNRICFMVNTADWLYTRIELDGETLDLGKSQVSNFRRELNFRTGELRREFIWKTSSGKQLKLAFSRFLSMRTNEVGVQRITLTPLNFSGPVTLTLGIDFSVMHQMYGENFWNCPRVTKPEEAGENRCAILGISKYLKQNLFAGFTVQIGQGSPREQQLVTRDQFIGKRFVLDLAQGQSQTVDKLAVLYTTRVLNSPEDEVWQQGMEILKQQRESSYETLFQQNIEYWNAAWASSDICIEGDLETQQGIRFCIFQLQQTYRGAVPGANIGAKGLTGEAYNGNAFWDTETYCLPYYIFSNPASAKALIDFRYKTLSQAMERARQLDCQGACFPIATCDGTESCTLWQHASLQLQPTTAVAYAIWHYVKVTQDTDFLYNQGIELLVHICRFLASRGQWSPRRKQFGYYAVMGPDEFQMMVNNNCYTNFMAKQTFLYTLQVLSAMQQAQPEEAAALERTLSLTPDEISAWQSMAENMILPRDPQTGIYEQHEGFFDLPHIDVDQIPVEDFPLYHNWSYDRIYRNDMIKQPDVLMFMLLYNQSFTLAEKQANYDYYEPRCIHESSLSPSVHSIFATELGRPEEAFQFFQFATRIDLDNYNRNTAEGVHMTSIAAAWMNIVYGFGGMRSDGELLVFNPSIPKQWQSYSFQLVYRGSILKVQVTQKFALLQVLQGEPITALVQGKVCQIDCMGLAIPLQP